MEPPAGLNEADFETIEAAVMETARGRWFLAEYSRRCRAHDTGRILGAIDRLEGAAFEAKAGEARANDNLERAAELVRLLVEVVHARRSPPPISPQESPSTPRPMLPLEDSSRRRSRFGAPSTPAWRRSPICRLSGNPIAPAP
jgi:hypothetical protein